MPDICTLVLITTMNAVACIPATVCTKDPDPNGRVFCHPDFGVSLNACNKPPPPTYDCKKPDGTTYTYQEK